MLVLLPTSSSKLLKVRQQVGGVDYEVKRMGRGGGAWLIYHLNLIKPWRDHLFGFGDGRSSDEYSL